METNNVLHVCGSVTKTEALSVINVKMLENTSIAEAHLPYAHYYGHVPERSRPNSLFLFTSRFYALEEVIRFSQGIEYCKKDKVNIASAMLEFQNELHPAIRVKYFPDYLQLHQLQKCLKDQGVELAGKLRIPLESKVTIYKCFVLEKSEPGILWDKTENNKGYIVVPKRLALDEFKGMMDDIRNNSDCHLFDAALCAFISKGEVTEMIRIFSEGLKTEMLKCIQKNLDKRFGKL